MVYLPLQKIEAFLLETVMDFASDLLLAFYSDKINSDDQSNCFDAAS